MFLLKIWLFPKHCFNFLCILPYCAGQATAYKTIQPNAGLLMKIYFPLIRLKEQDHQRDHKLVALSIT